MVQLQRVYPSVTKELKELVIDFNERLKHEVVPQLFNKKHQVGIQREFINEDALSFILKYNTLMSQASLKDASDSDFVKDMASFGVANFT